MVEKRKWASRMPYLGISFLFLALGSSSGYTAHTEQKKIVLFLERIDVLHDGNRTGKGKLRFDFSISRSSENCKRLHLEYGRGGAVGPDPNRTCKEWRWRYPAGRTKTIKVSDGETKSLKRWMPGPAIGIVPGVNSVSPYDAYYVKLQPPDVLRIKVSVFEPRRAKMTYTASFRSPNWGIGRYAKKTKRPHRSNPQIRLHFQIQPWSPDLALKKIYTVPGQPSGLTPRTKMCVRVSNLGNVYSSPALPVVYIDNMSNTYSSLRRMDRIGPGETRAHCGSIRNPGPGTHQVRVQLEPIFGDSNPGNHRLDRTITWQGGQLSPRIEPRKKLDRLQLHRGPVVKSPLEEAREKDVCERKGKCNKCMCECKNAALDKLRRNKKKFDKPLLQTKEFEQAFLGCFDENCYDKCK